MLKKFKYIKRFYETQCYMFRRNKTKINIKLYQINNDKSKNKRKSFKLFQF